MKELSKPTQLGLGSGKLSTNGLFSFVNLTMITSKIKFITGAAKKKIGNTAKGRKIKLNPTKHNPNQKVKQKEHCDISTKKCQNVLLTQFLGLNRREDLFQT